MSTLTLKMPDAKYERLKLYAKSKNISLNKLFDEFATIVLTQLGIKSNFSFALVNKDRVTTHYFRLLANFSTSSINLSTN